MTTPASTIDAGVRAAALALSHALSPTPITPPGSVDAAWTMYDGAQRELAEIHTQLTQLAAQNALAEHDQAAWDALSANVHALHAELSRSLPEGAIAEAPVDIEQNQVRDTIIVAQQALTFHAALTARLQAISACTGTGGAHDDCVASAVHLNPTPGILSVRISGGVPWFWIGAATLGGLAALAGVALWSKRASFLRGFHNPRPRRITAKPSHRFRKRYDLEVEED